jgi:hypothetical protein
MNKKNFDLMMNKFSLVFERALNPSVISIYWDICSEVPDSQVNTVIRNCIKKCQFFPRPADIFKSFDETAMESHKVVTIELTEEERKNNLKRLKQLQDDLVKKVSYKEDVK